MKLSRVKLIKLVKNKLDSLGFTEFRDTKGGFQGLFIKKITSDLYLTLGLTIHRYHDSAFTADYYLSKSTIIGAIWNDIPNESYKRLGALLSEEERCIYPEDDINVKGTSDIWWYGTDEKSVGDFLRVVELTESRFISQPDLIFKIRNSQEVKILSDYSEKVKAIAPKDKIDGIFNFLPVKEINGIPINWFKASEKVLRESQGILNSYTVQRLASDAFIQYQLDNMSIG